MKIPSLRLIFLTIFVFSGLCLTAVWGSEAFPIFSGQASPTGTSSINNLRSILSKVSPSSPLVTVTPPSPPLVVSSGTAPTGLPGGFGIEGDLLANAPTNNVSDWLANGGGTGVGVLTAAGLPINALTTYSSVSFSPGELFSDQADEAFTQGSKVNDNPNTGWTWTSMKPTGKDDIHRGFFTTSIDGSGHTWVAAGADRLSTNGTSYIDFEFLQNTLVKNSNGTFTSAGPDGGRTVGDLLVTLELTGGGGTANFIVQRWQAVGAGFDYVTFTPPVGTFFSCANAGSVSVPFGAFGGTTYAANQFAETAFDLTALLPTLNPCIGIKTVLIKTKSSASNTAALKDFIAPFQVNLGTSPIANAGADLASCQMNPTTPFTVNGTATNGTPTWSVVSTTGGATAAIVSPNSATTAVNVTGTGTVTLRLSVASASCGTATDDVVLTVNVEAIAQIVPDVTSLTQCQTGSMPTVFSLSGIVSAGSGSPLWSVLPGGTAMAVIATPNATTTDVTVTGAGFVDIQLRSWVTCGEATDTIRLTVNPSPMAAAGIDQTKCITGTGPTSFNLTGTVTNGTPLWSVDATQSTTTATIMNGNTATPTVSVNGTGVVTMVLTVTSNTNPSCGTAMSEVKLTVNPLPTATINGSTTVCAGTPVELSVDLTGTGPWNLTWSDNFTQNGVTASPAKRTVTPAMTTTYSVTTVADALCSNTGTGSFTVNVSQPPTQANAGADQTLCTTSPAILAANAPSVGTGMWSIVSGPSSLTTQFSSLTSPTATFTPAGGAGKYILRWTISNAPCAATQDDVEINYSAPPTPANAGADQTVCTTTATLGANAPTVGTGVWSIVSGPSSLLTQFSSTTSPTATFTPTTTGTYTLRWTISNTPCTASFDDVIVKFDAPPTQANAGADQLLCLTTPATLAANTPTVGTGAWSIVSGPSTSLAQFSSTTSPAATFSPIGGAGKYTLRWTISNASCTPSFDDVEVVFNSPVSVDAGVAQTVTACNAVGGIKLAGVIGGGATGATWSGGNGTFTPNNTTLNATYTPTATEIANGSVTLTLTTDDPAGPCGSDADNVTITITACADLSLTKSVDNPTQTVGQNVVFTITVTNAGPSTATNVTVKDVLPAGLSFVSADPAGAYNSGTGIWTVGTIVKDATATLKITATVTQNATITNIAEVATSDQPDPDSTPNNQNPSEDDQAPATLNPSTFSNPSDQKTGSLLVYPYYTSSNSSDTRLTITNVGARQTYVHLLFLDGVTCQQSDLYLCLTPFASAAFQSSEFDPLITGYMLAIAVNEQGNPIANNSLIGNAFVRNGLQATDTYGAIAFYSYANAAPAVGGTTELRFDGVMYERVPNSFAVEIQSPLESAQTLVTVGLNGNVNTGNINGASMVGVGQVINGRETPVGSFSGWHVGNCQVISPITVNSPRVPGSMAGVIPSGDIGTMRFNVGAATGLLFSRGSKWSGIRPLHDVRKTSDAKLIVPVFMPVC